MGDAPGAQLQQTILEAVVQELLAVLRNSLLGPSKSIYCYRPLEGGNPVRAFLDGLPLEAQASYLKSFEKHCQGHTLRGDKHRPWTEDGCERLFEYKDIQSKTRILHTTDRGNLIVLLYGFGGKNENKVEQRHVNAGQRLRDEYERRRNVIATRVSRERNRR